jgi:hypothetical protein
MAGWDGDALAGSMEQAIERQEQAEEERRLRREKNTPQDRELKLKAETVRLSIARLNEQLGRATNPAHRAMLEKALKALDAETISEERPREESSN